jgi:hypothetical protein
MKYKIWTLIKFDYLEKPVKSYGTLFTVVGRTIDLFDNKKDVIKMCKKIHKKRSNKNPFELLIYVNKNKGMREYYWDHTKQEICRVPEGFR